MPHVEIFIYDDPHEEQVYYAYEKADSLDPQDLQDALSEAFHSVEQDIWWYGDECETPEDEEPEEPCGWDDCCAEPFDPEPIGVAFLGEVVDMRAFRDFSVIVSRTFADAGVRVLNAIGQPPFRLRDESSGYDRPSGASGYDADDGDDLLPRFSD